MKTFEYPHFSLIAESYGRTLADGGDTILLTPGHPRYTFKVGTLNYDNRYYDAAMQPVACTSVRQGCDRAFFRRGARWIDSRLVGRGEALAPQRVVTLGQSPPVGNAASSGWSQTKKPT